MHIQISFIHINTIVLASSTFQQQVHVADNYRICCVSLWVSVSVSQTEAKKGQRIFTLCFGHIRFWFWL